jgi:hypothetical protein
MACATVAEGWSQSFQDPLEADTGLIVGVDSRSYMRTELLRRSLDLPRSGREVAGDSHRIST